MDDKNTDTVRYLFKKTDNNFCVDFEKTCVSVLADDISVTC